MARTSARYYLERDAQPDVFTSVPATMWWSVTAMTTVTSAARTRTWENGERVQLVATALFESVRTIWRKCHGLYRRALGGVYLRTVLASSTSSLMLLVLADGHTWTQ